MLTLSLTRKQEGWWAAMLARKTPLTLQDCLQGYTQEETLPVCPLLPACCLHGSSVTPRCLHHEWRTRCFGSCGGPFSHCERVFGAIGIALWVAC